MEGLCLGPWVMLVYLTCWMDGGMWMCAAGSCQGRQSPEWGQMGPLITVLGGKVALDVPELGLPTQSSLLLAWGLPQADGIWGRGRRLLGVGAAPLEGPLQPFFDCYVLFSGSPQGPHRLKECTFEPPLGVRTCGL